MRETAGLPTSGRFFAFQLVSSGLDMPMKAALAMFGIAWALLPAAALTHEIPAAAIQIPAQFDQASHTATDSSDYGDEWWKLFKHPELDALMERVHADNTSIQQAAARLASARAMARLDATTQRPQIGLDASASHASGPLINDAGSSGSLFAARLAVSWEADLLGKLSGQHAAGRLDAAAAEAMLRDTRLLVEAETASAYFRQTYLQQVKVETDRIAALRHVREQIAESRLRSGLGQKSDLDQLRQNSLNSAAAAAEMARQLAVTHDLLGFLVSETDVSFSHGQHLPDAPMVPSDLPSAVLMRRPDVQAAVDRLQAADKRLQSTRRNWLPGFSLTASGGAASPSIGQILSSSARDFGLGLLFSIPLLDGGRHKAQVAGGLAELDLAKAQYRASLLAALREVNDALARVAAQSQQLQLARESLGLHQDAGNIIASRAAHGTASRAELLETELASSEAKLKSLDLQYQRLAAIIDLVKALGGGWAAASSEP